MPKITTQKSTAALLYIGVFAGIPLAIIVALFFLPVLNSVDPAAIVILTIFTVVLVALWIFVPREKTVVRQRKSAKARKAAVPRAVPAPSDVSEETTGDEKKRKARSRRPLFEEGERREPFVDAVEESTHHPAAQPQVRRKAQSKARKKSSKKKKR
ncbi:MAG: hypothetical protein ACXV2D_09195 [Halobacteriota archaeon]